MMNRACRSLLCAPAVASPRSTPQAEGAKEAISKRAEGAREYASDKAQGAKETLSGLGGAAARARDKARSKTPEKHQPQATTAPLLRAAAAACFSAAGVRPDLLFSTTPGLRLFAARLFAASTDAAPPTARVRKTHLLSFPFGFFLSR